MCDSHVVCPVCHGDGFIVKEYRRFADGGAYIESFDSDCPKCNGADRCREEATTNYNAKEQ
jgi:DnaJ-class molecular chaperone